jgi:F-type H+-transporting ATPase subunit epsilon
VTLRVELAVPDGEIWSGEAQLVIAKTLDGDIGVLTGHAPVIGILVSGSLVRIIPDESETGEAEVVAAVAEGFFSVADDRVSILARQAELGREVDRAAAQAALDSAMEAADQPPGEPEPSDVRYARAVLRAAGERP